MDTTSTLLVTNAISSTKDLFSSAGVPTFYVFLALFLFLWGMGIAWWALVSGTKRITRSAMGKRL